MRNLFKQRLFYILLIIVPIGMLIFININSENFQKTKVTYENISSIKPSSFLGETNATIRTKDNQILKDAPLFTDTFHISIDDANKIKKLYILRLSNDKAFDVSVNKENIQYDMNSHWFKVWLGTLMILIILVLISIVINKYLPGNKTLFNRKELVFSLD